MHFVFRHGMMLRLNFFQKKIQLKTRFRPTNTPVFSPQDQTGPVQSRTLLKCHQMSTAAHHCAKGQLPLGPPHFLTQAQKGNLFLSPEDNLPHTSTQLLSKSKIKNPVTPPELDFQC